MNRWIKRVHAFTASSALLFLLPIAAADTPAAGQTLRDVEFSDYGQPSSNAELMRRLVSPLAAAQLKQELLKSGKRWADQPIDVSAERFLVQVPSQPPAAGYGLLVFVPPWQDARIPQGWAEILNDFGVIYVSAARSGNEESVLGRREPLALLAAHNIMRRYSVDPERVYVAGFSGGSRVALRLVLGYPDLFHGAILNAGSDSIGNADIPLPPRDLLLRFQSSVHLVYITGERDEPHVSDDLLSVRSMRRWCMYNVTSFLQPLTDHEVAAPAALSRALSSLARSAPPDPAKLAACRSVLDSEMETGLHAVESLIAGGQKARAQKRLKSVDERFGGLAAPRTVELASRF
ncbi:MAG TPA: PHB depolymerase family esterase [Steroidobacteraceae bacterium]|nr:PHB depolymerase family esterase [Steroidobacteraceae bacterium]